MMVISTYLIEQVRMSDPVSLRIFHFQDRQAIETGKRKIGARKVCVFLLSYSLSRVRIVLSKSKYSWTMNHKR